MPSSDNLPSQTIWLYDDIIPEILAYLYNDKHTLSSCTLVCRSWLHSASQHLFRKIRFRSLRPAHLHGRDMHIATYRDFLAFLEACPRARVALQKLTLRSSHDTWHIGPNYLPLSTLHDIIKALPHLRVLKLGLGNSLQICKSAECEGVSERLKVDKVVLGDVVNTDSEHVLDLFALFSFIGDLRFKPAPTSGLDHETLSRSVLDSYAKAPKLAVESLSFRFSTYDSLQYVFLDVIKKILSPKSLRRIHDISISKFSELFELDAFIRHASHSLEELRVRVYSVNMDSGFQTPLHGRLGGITCLPACLNLTHLVLYMDLWPWQYSNRLSSGNARSFKATLSIIESACLAPSIKEIQLVLLLRHNALSVPPSMLTPPNVLARVRELPWEELNDVMSNAQGTTLTHFRVRLDKSSQGDGEPWLRDELREILDGKLTARLRKMVDYC